MMTAPASVLPDPRVEDAELLVRARAGEDFACNLLFRRHAPFVAAVALRLTKSQADADDVVQETFAVAFRRLHQLERPQALRGWLAQIAVSFVHRKLRFQRFLSLFATPTEERMTLDAMASTEASPEIRAQLAQLDTRLGQLPQKLKTPWVLRYVLGCSLDEIATACQVSLATAKRRLKEAGTVLGFAEEDEEVSAP